MMVQEPVQAAIWHCLNHYAYQDATFLAERLCSEVDNDESAFTLATCYYRTNQIHQAYWLLQAKASTAPQCRYLQAKCAFELQRFDSVESTLINDSFTESRHLDTICGEFGEVACFALQLIAKICTQTERHDMAAEANRRALKLNPFLWQSFADLCNRGQKPDAADIFRLESNDTFDTCQGRHLASTVMFNGATAASGATPATSVHTNRLQHQQQPNQPPPQHQPATSSAASQMHCYTPVSSTMPSAASGASSAYDMQTPQAYSSHHGLITPNNYHTLGTGSSLGMDGMRPIEETPPVSNGNAGYAAMDTADSGGCGIGGGLARTPFQKQFKYLSSISPSTPSFGFLPMSSPADQLLQTPQPLAPHQQQQPPHQPAVAAQTPQQPQHQLQIPTSVGKKLRGTSSLISRKEAAAATTPLQLSKPPIFSQTGGNITPRTPVNQPPASSNAQQQQQQQQQQQLNVVNVNGIGGNNVNPNATNVSGSTLNVRRSSRLSFSNCSSAVKENNKSSAAAALNKFATPRSPPRKTKQRISKMNLANTALNELNSEKLKSTTASSTTASTTTVTSEKTIEAAAAAAAAAAAVVSAAAVTATATASAQPPTIGAQSTATTTIDDLHQQHQRLLQHQQQQAAAQMMQLRRTSADGLMQLLRHLGTAYAQLADYDCARSVETFAAVAAQHYHSSWVQSMVAKAHYELHQYELAAKHFEAVHKREPHRQQLMEIYSTVLWHLHRDVALSALAQDLVAQDKLSPVTWCVAGNCFSLHKEHETAIKFFERAVHVDPDFAYSYTLLGHELVITEELDKAMSCFRTAILKDSRHYNAWFGIGTIFSKQERYNLAEIHYQHALRINPRNSVIMVHIGTMQFALKHADKALRTLNAAIRLDPKNPLCKFHRGSMYFQMGKDREALAELEELKQLLPKESVVYYLIGKIHKKMGNVAAALKHFSWATDLDPRGANNQIKDAFDTNMSSSGVGTSMSVGAGGAQLEPMTPAAGGAASASADGDSMSAAAAAVAAAVNSMLDAAAAAAADAAGDVSATTDGDGDGDGDGNSSMADLAPTEAATSSASTSTSTTTDARQLGQLSATNSSSSSGSAADSGVSNIGGLSTVGRRHGSNSTGNNMQRSTMGVMDALVDANEDDAAIDDIVDDVDDHEDVDEEGEMDGRDYDSDSY